MNSVILVGRTTRNPVVRYTAGDAPLCVARFTLAVDRRGSKDKKPEADFISCIAYGKTGQFIEKYVQKGIKLIVQGHIQTGSYTGKDGKQIYTTDVVVENAEFAESRNARGAVMQSGGSQEAGIHGANAQGLPAGFESVDVLVIPFA